MLVSVGNMIGGAATGMKGYSCSKTKVFLVFPRKNHVFRILSTENVTLCAENKINVVFFNHFADVAQMVFDNSFLAF